MAQSEGRVSPRLKVAGVLGQVGTSFSLVVVSTQSEPGFRIDTSHGGVWAAIALAQGLVRLLNPAYHNPAEDDERRGQGEAYGSVTEVLYDAAAKTSYLFVTFDTAWERGGLLLADLVRVGAYVLLPDVRAEAVNPQNIAIQPIPAQGAGGADVATVGSAGPKPRFDGHLSLIGA